MLSRQHAALLPLQVVMPCQNQTSYNICTAPCCRTCLSRCVYVAMPSSAGVSVALKVVRKRQITVSMSRRLWWVPQMRWLPSASTVSDCRSAGQKHRQDPVGRGAVSGMGCADAGGPKYSSVCV